METLQKVESIFINPVIFSLLGNDFLVVGCKSSVVHEAHNSNVTPVANKISLIFIVLIFIISFQHKTISTVNRALAGFHQKMLIPKFVSDGFDNPNCFLDI